MTLKKYFPGSRKELDKGGLKGAQKLTFINILFADVSGSFVVGLILNIRILQGSVVMHVRWGKIFMMHVYRIFLKIIGRNDFENWFTTAKIIIINKVFCFWDSVHALLLHLYQVSYYPMQYAV